MHLLICLLVSFSIRLLLNVLNALAKCICKLLNPGIQLLLGLPIIDLEGLKYDFNFSRSSSSKYFSSHNNFILIKFHDLVKPVCFSDRFALWTARSLTNRTTIVCDHNISLKIDISLSQKLGLKNSTKELSMTLTNHRPDHQLYHDTTLSCTEKGGWRASESNEYSSCRVCLCFWFQVMNQDLCTPFYRRRLMQQASNCGEMVSID